MKRLLLISIVVAYFSTNVHSQWPKYAYPDNAITKENTPVVINVLQMIVYLLML